MKKLLLVVVIMFTAGYVIAQDLGGWGGGGITKGAADKRYLRKDINDRADAGLTVAQTLTAGNIRTNDVASADGGTLSMHGGINFSDSVDFDDPITCDAVTADTLKTRTDTVYQTLLVTNDGGAVIPHLHASTIDSTDGGKVTVSATLRAGNIATANVTSADGGSVTVAATLTAGNLTTSAILSSDGGNLTIGSPSGEVYVRKYLYGGNFRGSSISAADGGKLAVGSYLTGKGATFDGPFTVDGGALNVSVRAGVANQPLMSLRDPTAQGGSWNLVDSTGIANAFAPMVFGTSHDYGGLGMGFVGAIPSASDQYVSWAGGIYFEARVATDGGAGTAISNANLFSWADYTTPVMVMDKDGRLGIGDETPAALLTVGNGDKFQVDTNGNVKTPSIEFTGTARSDGGVLSLSSFSNDDTHAGSLSAAGVLRIYRRYPDYSGTARIEFVDHLGVVRGEISAGPNSDMKIFSAPGAGITIGYGGTLSAAALSIPGAVTGGTIRADYTFQSNTGTGLDLYSPLYNSAGSFNGGRVQVNDSFDVVNNFSCGTTVQAITAGDGGVAVPGNKTFTPSSCTATGTCYNTGGCPLVMDETGAVSGERVALVNIGTNPFTIADSAGVFSGSNRTIYAGDVLNLVYANSQWYEMATWGPAYGSIYTDNGTGTYKDLDNVLDCTNDADMVVVPFTTTGVTNIVTAQVYNIGDGGVNGFNGLVMPEGTYRLSASISADAAQNSVTLYAKLRKAGAELPNCEAQTTFPAAGPAVSQLNLTISCLATFTAGQVLDLAVCSTNVTDDYDPTHANLSVVRLNQ